jgi:hypothetical protein
MKCPEVWAHEIVLDATDRPPRTNECWAPDDLKPVPDGFKHAPDGFKHAPDLPRTTPAPWNSSTNLCSSLNDPYASEASSPFPNNHYLNKVQLLK